VAWAAARDLADTAATPAKPSLETGSHARRSVDRLVSEPRQAVVDAGAADDRSHLADPLPNIIATFGFVFVQAARGRLPPGSFASVPGKNAIRWSRKNFPKSDTAPVRKGRIWTQAIYRIPDISIEVAASQPPRVLQGSHRPYVTTPSSNANISNGNAHTFFALRNH
jgi:hypothetical protein